MFQNRIWQFVTVTCMAVIFIYSMQLAIVRGRIQAQAEATASESQELLKALDFFYNDQGRFPSAFEFTERQDKNILKAYTENFPPKQISSQTCTESFRYERVTQKSYKLLACVPVATSGLMQGWNTFSVAK